MSARTIAIAIALALAACASPRVIEAGEPVTAFTGVTVITRYGDARLANHTVVVRGDRIIAVEPDGRVRLPGGATLIAGEGRMLAPGLADMHVHFFSEDDGALYLANGVTAVRNMSGLSDASLPERIAAGTVPGPALYSAGALIDGPGSFWGAAGETTTPDEVRARVRQNAADGYLAAKLYAELSPEQFAAGVEEARALGLQVYAHVPRRMSLEQVLAHRVDSIEHLDGFDRSLGVEGASVAARWAAPAADRYGALARNVAAAESVWNTPTLIVLLAPSRAFADMNAAAAAPEMRYINTGVQGFWRSYYDRLPAGADTAARYRTVEGGHANRLRMVRALYEAGAPLLIGTDAPNPYVYPGFAIHEELRFFRDAGLTPAQVLRIATADAARFLRQEGEFGFIAEGARADLVLLRGDPEADLEVLRAPEGVMAAGRWRDRATLDALLEGVAQRARPQ